MSEKTWTPESWNTCPKCEGYVDAPDVCDGSEVHCDDCGTSFVVVIPTEGEPWLSDIEPAPPSDQCE